ncbi:hypothetical protein pdam_00007098 [Pocillopora damicornis]|uniref:Uncharacterized protein n=1 Tax=Pocillopora damicornis TaxID=46731 RepID=A0A3M6T954_POCDA|nr:hypothetical protein pdam_00007098 [Pocillopora damicornis]
MQRILLKPIVNSLIQKGSWLAHLYGLPKTHKKKLAVCPILLATGTYNYKLAKWLDNKLKPLSVNNHTVSVIFLERPRTTGRPPKHYHPLLKKEKELFSIMQRIIPLIQKGLNPQQENSGLSDAVGDRNLQLEASKWLDNNLKPLSVNEQTVSVTFLFADDLHQMKIGH